MTYRPTLAEIYARLRENVRRSLPHWHRDGLFDDRNVTAVLDATSHSELLRLLAVAEADLIAEHATRADALTRLAEADAPYIFGENGENPWPKD